MTMSSLEDTGARDVEALDALAALPWEGRAIMLVDLDAFFASVEQLDHPGWRGKPVIVGGDADKRGVVSTASYEARAFGVRSAMPSSTARRLCPDAIWTTGNYGRYKEMSGKVMDILRNETPHVQQVSIDEAFLDVSPTRLNRESPVAIARRIQQRVEQLGVSCSIGIGTTKAVAKLASDMDKPRGLTVVLPGSEASFMGPLPVRALSGIGASAERKLRQMGIYTLGDLAAASDDAIVAALGKVGRIMLDRARNIDDASVEPDTSVKSVSGETSFAQNLSNGRDIKAAMATMAAKVGRRLRRKGLRGTTLTLKLRYANLSVRTVQRQLDEPSDDEFLFIALLDEMLLELWHEGVELRLVGVGISGFDGERAAPDQLSLFDAGELSEVEPRQTAGTPRVGETRRRELMNATDLIKERFGESSLRYGRELRLDGNTTGSSSKNPADYK